jgi:hypothetical protein
MGLGEDMKQAMERASDANDYNQLPDIAIEALGHGCETVKEIIRYSRKHGKPITTGGRYLAQRLRKDGRIEVAEERRGGHMSRYKLKPSQEGH